MAAIISEDDLKFYNTLENAQEKKKFIDYATAQMVANNGHLKLVAPVIGRSIEKYGWGTDNAFLTYIQEFIDKRVDVDLTIQQADLIRNVLNDNGNKYPLSSMDFLFDARSYNGDQSSILKLQTLFFLKSDESKNFGDDPESLFEKVLDVSDNGEIKTLLDSWQTRSPETRRIKSVEDSDKSRFKKLLNIPEDTVDTNLSVDQKIKLEAFENIYKLDKKGVGEKQIANLVTRLYKSGDTANSLTGKVVAELTKSVDAGL